MARPTKADLEAKIVELHQTVAERDKRNNYLIEEFAKSRHDSANAITVRNQEIEELRTHALNLKNELNHEIARRRDLLVDVQRALPLVSELLSKQMPSMRYSNTATYNADQLPF